MYEAFTYCDFGTAGRKDTLSRHRSAHTARRHFRHFRKVYGGPRQNGEVWRLWQEDRQGNILSDTNQAEKPSGA